MIRQIEEKKRKDVEDRNYDKSYFKPHFGPEEDQARIKARVDEEVMKKKILNEHLKVQIQQNKALSEASR